jgi:Ribbon-helix-helix protein, copG family
MISTRYRRLGPRITISLAGADYDQLQALAAKSEVSVSWVVRRAIEEFLRKQRRGRSRPGRLVHKREDVLVDSR